MTNLSYTDHQWIWQMDWCSKNGLAPANAKAWSRAEAAWIAMNLGNRKKV